MKNQHKHVLARLLVGAFLLLGFGLWTSHFVVDAANWTVGSITRNNTNFLSGAFWDNSPTSGDIIKALYGSGGEGTAYTQNWSGYTSGSCLSGGMNVVYIPEGTSTLPLFLANNTVYILTGIRYITTGEIQLGNCTALVSTTGSIIQSTGYLTGLLNSISKNFVILNNIQINSEDDGDGSTHTGNANGIYIQDSNNITIQAAKFYKHGNTIALAGGIHLKNTNYTHIVNSEVYDGLKYGIVLENSNYNIIEYSSFFGNHEPGIYFYTSSYNVINNTKSFNNQNVAGILLNGSNLNTINNSSFFNNQNGLHIQSSSGIVLNNIESSNNTDYGIYFQNSIGGTLNNINSCNNTYGLVFNGNTGFLYGDINIFDNTSHISGAYILRNANSFLGWSEGILTTGDNKSWEYLINSQNSLEVNLLSRGDNITSTSGYKARNPLPHPIIYSYGSGTLMQESAVFYSGAEILAFGTYTTAYIIGSSSYKITGPFLLTGAITLHLSNIYTNTGNISVYIADNNDTFTYRIFGDIINEKTGSSYPTINIITGITLSGTDGIKHIFGQAKNPYSSDYTHFTQDIILDTTTPVFTGTTLEGNTIMTGGYYTTGVIITFADTNISGAIVNGSGYIDGTTITTGGTYIFLVSDRAGNSTGITFTIDTTTPTLAGVTSGAYYSGNVVITGSDTYFSGFQLSGISFTGTSLTVTGEGLRVLTGYDRAGNTTGVTFIIDKTTPVFTGTTLGSLTSGNVATGGYYNTGVKITFADTNISGAIVNGSGYTGGTTITTGGAYIFVVRDLAGNSTGMTFTIDTTNPLVTGNYPTSGLNYTGGNTIVFTRSGSETNLSGYTLYINSTGYAMGTGITYTTGLINGSYTRYVVATDRAGNTGTSQIYPFGISTPFSGSISITGTTIIGTQYFTNSAVGIYMQSNEPISYSITGDVRNAPITGTINNQGGRMIHSPTLTGADGSKDIYVTITNASGVTISRTFLVQLDTTAPGATLTSPTSGATVINSPVLTWSMNYPDPAHISGYQYFVSPTAAFGTVIASGYTTGTSVTLSGAALGLSNTTLYRYVKTLDSLGNSGVSVIQPFYYSGIALDTTPDAFSFSNITNARIHRVYGSNTITIAGMTANTPVLASINRGALYISGEFVGTTGYIQNGWTAKIELTSSSDYDEYVTSTLTIGGVSATFRVTTMEEDDDTTDDYEDIDSDLSSTEKLQIIAVFETLRDLYNGDKETEFFNSLLVMLESKIDDLGTSTNDKNKRDALQYLYDLAENYGDGGSSDNNDIDNTSRIKNGIYTAPNGKKYTISYDSNKGQFTSKNFITPKYFPTLDVLKYTIDMANPIGSQYANAKTIKARWGKVSIDGTWQTSAYTAPNRKAFYFFKTMEGRYSSYTFTVEKYFDSLEEVKAHIYTNNRK